jgi:hypothetical protein
VDDKASLRPIELALFPEAQSAKSAKIGQMLTMLGSIGAPAALTSVLAEIAGIKAPLDGMRYLRGPLVVHNTAWMADIPPWMAKMAMTERHEIVFSKSPYLVGPAEIAAVMFPAVMEAPLRSDAVELYLWACATASARHFRRPISSIWKSVGGRVITDKEVIMRGGRLWEEYASLSHEIRRKVIAVQTERERAQRRSGNPGQMSPKDKPPEITGTQLSLFDIAA